jgi:hypothetical protein
MLYTALTIALIIAAIGLYQTLAQRADHNQLENDRRARFSRPAL